MKVAVKVCLICAVIILSFAMFTSCSNTEETVFYTVTFMSDGMVLETMEIESGSVIIFPSLPTKVGFSSAWDVSSFLRITEDRTVNVVYTPKTYSVVYKVDGADYTTRSFTFSEVDEPDIAIPDVPEKEGHTGVWDRYSFATLSDSIIVNARYTKIRYTVSFEMRGGEEIAPITDDYGTELLVTPTYPGHSFVGWYTDKELKTPYTKTTIPAENLTLYAKWSSDVYSVVFFSDGSIVDTYDVDYLREISVDTIPQKIGFIFAGWYLDKDFADMAPEKLTVSENIYIYARWVEDDSDEATDASSFIFTENDDSSYTVSGVNNIPSEIIIPSIYNGKIVSAIGESAFADQAFDSITIPPTIVNIKDSAFKNIKPKKSELKTVSISFSGKSGLNSIGDCAFEDSKINTVKLPASLKTIGNKAFYNCTELESFSFVNPDKLSVLGGQIWENTPWYEGKIKEIQNGREVMFGNIIYSFKGKLPSMYLVSNTVVGIAPEAFINQTELTSINIGNSVRFIGVGSGRNDIKGVFYGCSALKRVFISSNQVLETIGIGAYVGCNLLEECIISSDMETYYSFSTEEFENSYAVEGYYIPKSLTALTLIGSMKTMPQKMFKNFEFLQEISLYNGLETISANAFENCKALKSLSIPSTVKTIGYKAFFGCMVEEGSISLPVKNALTTIDGYAFADLSMVVFDFSNLNALESVGEHAFRNCINLRSFIAPSIKSIAQQAFFGCGYIEEMSVPINVGEGYHIGYLFSKLPFTNSYKVSLDGFLDEDFYYLPNSLKKITIYANNVNDENENNGEIDVFSIISEYSFLNCTSITEVVIEKNIRVIGEKSFANTTNLSKISFADSIIKIEDKAFSASRLVEVTFGEQSELTTLGNGVFENNDFLKTVVFGKNVATLPLNCLEACPSLAFISFAEENPYFYTDLSGVLYSEQGYLILYPRGNVGTSYTVKDGTIAIAANAFANSKYIERIVLPAGLQRSGLLPFENCKNLAVIENASGLTLSDIINGSNVNISEVIFNTAKVPDYFAYGYGLDTLSFTSVDTIIGSNAFSDCYNLDNIDFSNVSSIGERAFAFSSISELSLSASVKSIEKEAFYNSQALVDVKLPQINALTYIGDKAFFGTPWFNTQEDAILSLGKVIYTGKNYKNATLLVNDGTEYITANAFADVDFVTSIVFPESVTAIGAEAFRGLDALSSITLPSSLQALGDYAFADCVSLNKIVFNGISSLDKFGKGVFDNTRWYNAKNDGEVFLTDGYLYSYKGTINPDYTIESSVRHIMSYAFEGQNSLYNLILSEGLVTIGDYAFANCSNLSTVSLNRNSDISSIGDYAFKNCLALTGFEIPRRVNEINYTIFDGCLYLKNISVENGNTSFFYQNISQKILYNFDRTKIVYVPLGLTGDIVLPEGLLEIPQNAFSDILGIRSVYIPNTVVAIGDSAFKNCEAITSITFEEGSAVESVGREAFSNTGLSSFVFPEGVTRVGYAALNECENLQTIEFLSETPPVLENTGYSFAGKVLVPRSSISLYSIYWDSYNFDLGKNFVRASFYVDGKEYRVLEVRYGESIFDYPEVPEMVGYDAAWSHTVFENLVDDVMVNAEYSVNTYYISLMSDEQTLYKTIDFLYGASVLSVQRSEILTDDTNIKLFIGWTTDVNGKNLFSLDTMPAQNLVLYPTWCIFSFSQIEGNNYQLRSALNASGNLTIPSYFMLNGERKEIVAIGNEVFLDNKSINIVYLPSSITLIGNGAFKNSSVSSVVFTDIIDSNLTTIGDNAFDSSTISNLILPDSLEIIGEYAFNNCLKLTGFVMPKNLSSIGERSFYGCNRLISVSFRNCVKTDITVYDAAFFGCSGLKQIINSEAITAIEEGAFRNCSLLTEFIFCDTLSVISKESFYGSGLHSLTIPASVTTLEDGCFAYSSLETINFELSNQNLSILQNAFFSCNNLYNVILPARLIGIGENAFSSCENLLNIVILRSVAEIVGYNKLAFPVNATIFIPNSIITAYTSSWNDRRISGYTYVDDKYIFNYDGSEGVLLRYIGKDKLWTVPSKVNYLTINSFDESLFNTAYSLNSLSIPNSLVHMFTGKMLSYCQSLTEIISSTAVDGVLYSANKTKIIAYPRGRTDTSFTIPETITDLGDYAFYKLDKMINLILLGSNPPSIEENTFGILNERFRFYVDSSSLSEYREEWSQYYERFIGDYIQESDYIVTNVEGGVEISQYIGKDTNINLPYAVGGKKVIGIGSYSFYNSNVKSVLIAANIEYVSEYAFANSTMLTTLKFQSGIKSIAQYAFYNCSITDIYFSSGTALTEIGQFAFAENHSLISLGIPALVANIGVSAFENCTALRKVSFSASTVNTVLSDRAFYNCSSLTSIDWTSSRVISIGNETFHNNSSLLSIVIPESVKIIEDNAFIGCSSLNSIVFSAGSTLTEIGNYAFEGVSALERITFPASLKEIGDYAFYYNKLIAVSFEDGSNVNHIGNYAFAGSSVLRSVTFPSSLKSIGEAAFSDARILNKITFLGTVPPTVYSDSFDKSVLFYVHNDYIPAYRTAFPSYGDSFISLKNISGSYSYVTYGKGYEITQYLGEDTEIIVPSVIEGKPVLSLGAYSFGYSITSVILPSTIVEIKNAAFYLAGISSITIPASVKIIKGNPFISCSQLENIFVESDSTFFCAEAGMLMTFDRKTLVAYANLYSSVVTIPYTVNSIIQNAFNGCDMLETLSVASSVSYIGDYAFMNCPKLRFISFDNSLTLDYLGDRVFDNTLWLKDIGEGIIYIDKVVYSYNGIIPENVTISISENAEKILSNAFRNQIYMNDLVIPYSVSEIGDNVLQGCYSLTSLTLGGTIKLGKYFGKTEYAFSYPVYSSVENTFYYLPTALSKVTLASKSNVICDYMFENCSRITTAIVSSSVRTIGKYAFANTLENGAMELNSLEFSLGELSTIEAYAFYGCTSLQELNIPYTVMKIYNGAFGGTEESPMSTRVLYFGSANSPSRLQYIGANAFAYSTSLSDLVMPSGLSYIGENAFIGNTQLISAYFSNSSSLSVLEDKAFYNCRSLREFNMSGAISYIGDYVFANCTELRNFTPVDPGYANLRYMGYKVFDNTPYYSALADYRGILYYGKVAYDYLGYFPVDGIISLAQGTVCLSPYIFSNFSDLTKVVIYNSGNNSTRAISDGGTPIYSGVTLELGNTLETIGDYVFSLIPDGVSFVVDEYNSLREVVLPASVKTVGEGAFINNVILDLLSFANTYHCGTNSQRILEANDLITVLAGDKTDDDLTNDLGILLDPYTKLMIDNYNELGFDLVIARLGKLDTVEGILSETVRILEEYGIKGISLSANNKTNISKLDTLGKLAFDNTSYFKNLVENAEENQVIYIENVAYGYKGTIPDNTELSFEDDTVAIAENGYIDIEKIEKASIPVDITYETEFTTVSAGITHSLALDKDGKIWAWGKNEFGQLGNNTNVSSNVAIKLSTDNPYSKVSPGFNHSLAIDFAGRIWAWGKNNFGQLGDNSTTDSLIPKRILRDSTSRFVEVYAGKDFSIALDTTGKIWSWGINDYGQLGNGDTINRMVPSLIMGTNTYLKVSLGNNFVIAIDTTYKLWGWGSNREYQIAQPEITNYIVPSAIEADKQFEYIAAGEAHVLAVDTEKTLWGWGRNTDNQVGSDSVLSVISSPTIVMTNITVAEIACGANYSLLLENRSSTGSSNVKKILWSWGKNDFGQLGNGSSENVEIPTEIAEDFIAISAGRYHAFAMKYSDDNSILTYGWGSNDQGQLGAVIRTSYDIKDNVGLVSISSNEFIRIISDGVFVSENDGNIHTVIVETADSQNCDLSGILFNAENSKVILKDKDIVGYDFTLTKEMKASIRKGFKIYVYGVNLSSFINADGWNELSDYIFTYDNIFDNYVMSYSEKGWEVIYYLGTANDVVVPSNIDGTPIYKIGANAFSNRIQSITLSENLEIIDRDAFADCINLTSITLPSTLIAIGDGAFKNCGKLTSITIPMNTVSIGKHAFENCVGLTTVDFSNCLHLETLDDYSFLGCTSITRLDLPTTVSYIGTYAFADCDRFVTLILRGEPPQMGGEGIYYEPRMSIYVYNKDIYINDEQWFIYSNRFYSFDDIP